MLSCMSSTVFGFATITAPQGGDSIQFDTNVNDVDVYVNGVMVGKKGNNSFVYKAARDGVGKVVTFKKEGYKDAQVILTTSFNMMFWGNFLVGGSLGSSTDSIFTKNNMQYSPSQYYIQLDKQ